MTTDSPSRLEPVEAILAKRLHLSARLDGIVARLSRVENHVDSLDQKLEPRDQRVDQVLKEGREALDELKRQSQSLQLGINGRTLTTAERPDLGSGELRHRRRGRAHPRPSARGC